LLEEVGTGIYILILYQTSWGKKEGKREKEEEL
jgi:hypothetical protein